MGNLNHKENEQLETSYDSNAQTCTLSFAIAFVNFQMGIGLARKGVYFLLVSFVYGQDQLT